MCDEEKNPCRHTILIVASAILPTPRRVPRAHYSYFVLSSSRSYLYLYRGDTDGDKLQGQSRRQSDQNSAQERLGFSLTPVALHGREKGKRGKVPIPWLTGPPLQRQIPLARCKL